MCDVANKLFFFAGFLSSNCLKKELVDQYVATKACRKSFRITAVLKLYANSVVAHSSALISKLNTCLIVLFCGIQ